MALVMESRRLLKHFYGLLLSIFLTAPAALGQAPATDRRAYVHAAYEGFVGALNFLAASDAFLNQLSPEERQQFTNLGNEIIKRHVRIGPGVKPGDDRTSNLSNIRLRFSDRHEDFIIAPDKVERTAKMDGDIWFNLNILNNSKTSFELLDAFQILFHEFGHTLGDKKDQALIDQVAAKIKTYLSAYHKESVIGPEVSAKTLILPYVLADGQPVDLQAEPIVILDVKGRAVEAALNVPAMRSPEQSYQATDGRAQSFVRMNLTPQFKNYDGKILIEWSVETKHYFINSERFNYMDLYINSAKVAPFQVLEPILAYKSSFQFIEPSDLLAKLPVAGQELKSIPLKTYAEDPRQYRPDIETKWSQKLKVTGQAKGRIELEAVIESAETVKEILLLGQHKTDVLKFPGEATRLTGNFQQLKFTIPDTVASSGPVYLNGIALNSARRWDLDEQMKIETKSVGGTPPTLQDVVVLNEGTWQGVRQIRTEFLNAEEIKMRFVFNNASAQMNHLEVVWIVQESILQNGENRGARFRTILEIFPREKLTQTLKDGVLSVEFASPKMSNYLPSEKGLAGFTTQDSSFRGMVSMSFVDQNLNVVGVPSRLVQGGWKSAFMLSKPRPASAPLCQKIFSP